MKAFISSPLSVILLIIVSFSGITTQEDPAPMPSVDGAKMGGTCELQVNALSGLSVAKLDGVCYDNKVTDRICCKNAGVLGKSDSDGGAVTIRQSCQANQYCCAVKAFLDKVKEVNVLC